MRYTNKLNEIFQDEARGDNKISPKLSLLIVDDCALIIDRIREIVEELPNIGSIKCCNSYDEAVALIQSFKPRLILLDLNLSGKSGIDVLRFSKSNLPATCVIIVSNHNSPYYQNLCLQLGADFFLDKSKDFERIAPILHSLS